MNELLQSIRSLLRAPVITATAVLTLAVAIAANVTVFSAANGLLLEELPFADPERLVVLSGTAPHQSQLPLSLPDFFDFEERSSSYEQLAAFRGMGYIYGDPEGARWVGVLEVTADIFEVLGIQPIAGRGFTTQEEIAGERVAVIGEHIWKERGARPLGANDAIRLDGASYRVIGIMPIDFRLPSASASDIWVPIGRTEHLMDRGNHSNTLGLGRLRPEATVEGAAAELEGIAAALANEYPNTNVGLGASVVSLEDELHRDYRPAILVLWGAVFLVLLIACANVTNLLLVRTEGRKREMAIRSALGATRGRMIRQLLSDGIVLAISGAALGLFLSVAAVDALRRIDDNRVMQEQIAIDGRVVLFAVGLSLFAGILAGIIPALRHFEGALIGRGSLLGQRDGSARMSRAMVAAQIGLALALTTGAALTVVSFAKLAKVDGGFDPRGVVQAGLTLPAHRDPAANLQTWQRLLERAQAMPGVEAAALSNPFPLTGSRSTTNVGLDGIAEPLPGQDSISIPFQIITSDYFRVLRTKVLEGRGFRRGDEGTPVAMVNRALGDRFWPGEEVVGKRIRVGDEWRTIVGVVESTRAHQIHAEPEATMYLLWDGEPTMGFNLAVRASNGAAESLVAPMRDLIRETDRDLPLDGIDTMDQLVGRSALRFRLLAGMLSAFSAVALLLATFGTWGVTAWSVARRTREIGIRMAMGADRKRIFTQLLAEGAVTAGIGIAVGIALAIPLALSLRSLLFGIEPADPAIALTSIALLGTATILAIALPVHRATRVDPNVALREE